MTKLKNSQTVTSKLFNFRPFFFAAICFCLGIAFCYFHIFYGVSAWWSLCLIPIALAPFLFCRTRRETLQRIIAITWLLVAFFVGFFGFSHRVHSYQDSVYYNGRYYVTGTVVGKTYHGDLATLTLKGVAIDEERVDGKLIAYLSTAFVEDLSLSDKILLQGDVQTITSCMGEYGFRASEIGDNVRFECNRVQNVVKVGKAFDPFLTMRNRLQERIYAGMDEGSAAITVAVLTGDSSGMESGLLQNMRAGGIAHIFAVSGLHVGALFGFCLAVLKVKPFRKLSKPSRFILLASLLLFYAGVCGFSPSILRATVICLVAYGATLLGTGTDFLESLGGAALVILLLQPTALFEVGFQLSFLACLGLALLSTPIQNGCELVYAKVRGAFPPRKLTDSERKMIERGDTLPPSIPARMVRSVISFVSVSLAAQIATAPLQLHTFGYFSPLSLLLNCIFVPMLTCVFAALLLCAIIACFLPVGAVGWLLGIPSMLWSGVLLLFEYVDFTKFVWSGWEVPTGGVISYYTGCTFLSDKWNLQRRIRYAIAAVCMLTFAVCLLLANL
ncbi:MAG: ComEC/Rec2 family competence protein [Clostridia bacterium]|nr:ComEC/Rec2 family competence protein [Clostridia bacterium]